MATYRDTIEGPRWAGLRTFLAELAAAVDVDLTITQHIGGIIRETVAFKVEGDDAKIAHFKSTLARSLAQYDRETR